MSNRKDVAELAGVSPAVVSYVINNSNYVSKEKRDAVLRAIEELNYHPNYLAKSLQQQRTSHLALVSRDNHNEMFSSIAFYMEQAAFEKGYFLSVFSCTSAEKANHYMSILQSKQYDGIFLASNVYSVEQINQMAETNIPIVLFEYRRYENLNPAITVFTPQAFDAVQYAVSYLIGKGHRRIGYIGDGNPAQAEEKGLLGEGLRANGYVEAMKANGLPVRMEFISFIEAHYFEESSISMDRIVVDYFNLPEGDRPTAYFVGTDKMAAFLIKSFRRRNIRVPEEIEIIGFGNTSAAKISEPSLTTINVDCRSIAERAVDALILKLAGKRVPNETFELDFIKRDSA